MCIRGKIWHKSSQTYRFTLHRRRSSSRPMKWWSPISAPPFMSCHEISLRWPRLNVWEPPRDSAHTNVPTTSSASSQDVTLVLWRPLWRDTSHVNGTTFLWQQCPCTSVRSLSSTKFTGSGKRLFSSNKFSEYFHSLAQNKQILWLAFWWN